MRKNEYNKDRLAIRVLFISPVFVPAADSEAFCGAKVAIGLLKKNVEVVVMSLSQNLAIQKDKDESELWNPLKNVIYQVDVLQNKNKIHSIFNVIQYKTFAWARWISSVVETAKLFHIKNNFDFIYTRSLPMIAHIIGYWVSKDLKIPWVANMNDPWDWHLFPDFYKKNISNPYRIASNYWFKKTINSADLLTYPSERLWKYHEKISGIVHKAEVIPHIGYGFMGKKDQETFTITHAGRMGIEGTARSPISFLKAVKFSIQNYPEIKSKMRVIFIGRVDNTTRQFITDLGLEETVKTTGKISYEESLRFIASSNMCLLIEGKMEEGIYLPSKFADYIVSKKPVLALSPSVGTINDLANHRGVYRVDVEDNKSIEEIITKHFFAFKMKKYDEYSPSELLIKKYDSETVIQGFINILNCTVLRNRNKIYD